MVLTMRRPPTRHNWQPSRPLVCSNRGAYCVSFCRIIIRGVSLRDLFHQVPERVCDNYLRFIVGGLWCFFFVCVLVVDVNFYCNRSLSVHFVACFFWFARTSSSVLPSGVSSSVLRSSLFAAISIDGFFHIHNGEMEKTMAHKMGTVG